MPSKPPAISNEQAQLLVRLGEALRQARKQQRVSAETAAEAAGMSRMTLHRIERGEPSVTIGAWIAAADVLGRRLVLVDPAVHEAPPGLPESIRLADYPQLREIAWQLPGVDELSPQDALALYERNWRHVDAKNLSMKEIALINALVMTIGGGRALV